MVDLIHRERHLVASKTAWYACAKVLTKWWLWWLMKERQLISLQQGMEQNSFQINGWLTEHNRRFYQRNMCQNIAKLSTKLCVVQKLQLYIVRYWRDITTKGITSAWVISYGYFYGHQQVPWRASKGHGQSPFFYQWLTDEELVVTFIMYTLIG